MRIRIALFLLKLADLIKSLPVVVMRPDDLVEISRRTYAKAQLVEAFSDTTVVDIGFGSDEQDLVDALPEPPGDLLLLGVGGGREAIPLAEMGFTVTGVDYVQAMVDRAIEHAARRGVRFEGLVQEISRLEVPIGIYDVVWLSRSMYSCVPTRARRVEMVRRIARALKPGGLFLCQFHWDPDMKVPSKVKFVQRLIAFCTLGNLGYEDGDLLWRNAEFLHAFSSEDDLRSELEEGGLIVARVHTGCSNLRGNAICRKSMGVELHR